MSFEFLRSVLLGLILLVGFMLWQAWQNDNPKQAPTPAAAPIALLSPSGQPVPVPSATTVETTESAAGHLVHVKTDVLDVVINLKGGNIVATNLLAYPKQLHSTVPYTLLTDNPEKLYVTQSGLIGSGGPDSADSQATYQTEDTEYQLSSDQNNLTVTLKWRGDNDVTVLKKYTFYRGRYDIGMDYVINNESAKPWKGHLYLQIQRKKVAPAQKNYFAPNAYMGAAISSPDKPYQKISFSKMTSENLNQSIQGGWAAMLEHYFLTAWIPDNVQTFNYYTQAQSGDLYTIGMIGPQLDLQAGEHFTTHAKLYAGPEIVQQLKMVAPNLDLTIDYGILWFIASAFFWVMKQIYQVVGNWGWSIIGVTLIIRLCFYHLSAKSFRSMYMMRKLQPQMQSIRERFGADRQKVHQATLELYKKEKVNPFLSGCLPMVIQIPFFIALYWVLLESVELRQAPFILWIHDLSAPDPFYVFPVLMGLVMFFQQKLNPAPPDPVQAKMMQFLPILFTFIFIGLPAGLVLYSVVNTLFSLLQQTYFTRKFARAAK